MFPQSQHETRSLPDRPTRASKRPFRVKQFFPLLTLLILALFLGVSSVSSSSILVPTTSVNSVVTDQTVTVIGYNFPKNQSFTVRMNVMHTLGIGGYVVDTVNTGDSTTFTRTFTIPAELRGQYQIAFRLDSPQGYFSYNWFYNNTTGYPPSPGIGYSGIPTISIVSVDPDNTVTFRTHNYPPNQNFTVTMGPMFSRGIGGYVAGSFNSGGGGSFEQTFAIPNELKGSYRIAIRAQTGHTYPYNPYYSYNWFFNNTSGGGTGSPGPEPTPGYTGIPTFSIVAVNRDNTVTIRTHNFPANQNFTLTMGEMYTRGINGIVVETFNSGAGGVFERTFNIPDALKGRQRISIRAQTAHVNPYFAYNWFWNNTTGTGGEPGDQPGQPYVGIPTIKICSVVRDSNVTFVTNNFPPNQTFTVTMGPMYSRGIGGTVVGTLDSGSGGALNATFPIPDHLKGSYRIAIRAQTGHANPYFAYNWFYNNTADVCP